MDAGVPDTASTSTHSLCISTPRKGNEKPMYQDRGSPLWHDSVHMEAARTGRGSFPVRALSTSGCAAMGTEVAPSRNRPQPPLGLSSHVEYDAGPSHLVSLPPEPSSLVHEGPRDHPPVVGPCLPVHGRPKSQLQSGTFVDPGRIQPPPPSTQPPPFLTFVHPSPPFVPRPAWPGSPMLQDHAIPEPKDSLPTPVPWGQPSWKPVPWTRMDLDSSFTGSYSYSGTRHRQASSSASEYLSVEDPLMVENAHHFPPRLPTDPPFCATHSRSSARKKIHWWISHHQETEIAGSDRGDPLEDVLVEEDDMALSVSSSESSHLEIEELWRLLNEKRSILRDLKSRMASKRQKMKELRLQKTDADNAFMSTIRPMMINKSGPHDKYASELDGRMAEMQALRTEYQDLETSYEELEEKLEEEERQLERVELRFFSLLGSAESESSEPEELASSGIAGLPSSDLPDDLVGISADKSLEDWHPLFVRLTLAVASLQVVQEEHLSLINIKKHCDEEVARKRATGQKITREVAEFLMDFPTQVKQKEDEYYESDEEVRRLRHICEEQGIMGKHLSVRMEKALNPGLELEDIKLPDEGTLIAENRTLAHPIFSELLSQPDHLLATPEPHTPMVARTIVKALPDSNPEKFAKLRCVNKEVQIDDLARFQDQNDQNKTGYINRWLLHSLRTSSLNAILLYSVFNATQNLRIRDLTLWQRDVLRFWWMDSTRTKNQLSDTSENSHSNSPPELIFPPSRPISERVCTMTTRPSRRRTSSVN